MNNKYPNLLIIPSLIVLGLIMLLPAKTIEYKNTASVVSPIETAKIPAPNIQARSALAVDLMTGKVLFEKNAQEKLPLASITKIISALVVLDNLNPDDFVKISKSAVSTEGVSSLKVGEHLTVKDLLAMAMVESSNDAISALAEATAKKQNIAQEDSEKWFTNLMQEKANSFGASNMVFNNPTGLDISTEISGGYGSADDLIKIVRASYSSDIWRFSSGQKIISEEGRWHILKPTNILEGVVPQLVGSKTGLTNIAGGNLLILFEYPINHPMAIVVLGSTTDGRFEDVTALFDYVKDVVNPK